jgi:nitrite reductase (NADH) small subunit
MAWLRICNEEELPHGRARTLDTAGGRIAVFRAENGVLYAIEDRCPHRGAALSQGVLYDLCKVACPDHGWTIDLASGRAEPPDAGQARTFVVEVRGEDVFVRLHPLQ